MTMSPELQAFLAATLYVTFKSFQQRNVAHGHYLSVPVASFPMGFIDLYIPYLVVQHGYEISVAFALGAGGTLGCWFGMWSHEKFHDKRRVRNG